LKKSAEKAGRISSSKAAQPVLLSPNAGLVFLGVKVLLKCKLPSGYVKIAIENAHL
jgi:hypothetical protein